MSYSPFLGLSEPAALEEADLVFLPLPFEGTACYGLGTGEAPPLIWQASRHIEDWDEETGFNLSVLSIYSAEPVLPRESEDPIGYLKRVRDEARRLRSHGGLLFGVGGEHSLTPALVSAAVDCGLVPGELTVVQFDAHADLRSSYEGSRESHACAMRRLLEMGARLVAVGIRSADEEEMRFGLESGQVKTYYAHELARDPDTKVELKEKLRSLSGPVYVTFDIDALEVHLCPATGTPQPGGMGWWEVLGYLRALLHENDSADLIGADLVETVPARNSRVNEFVAARLICKILGYWFLSRRG